VLLEFMSSLALVIDFVHVLMILGSNNTYYYSGGIQWKIQFWYSMEFEKKIQFSTKERIK